MELYPEFDKYGCTDRRTKFQIAGRRTFLNIDLDTLTNNINIIRSLVSDKTDIIAVLKGNAYGHGSVEIAHHLSQIGVRHFAVASPFEGMQLRQSGIQSFIQVFGNASEEEIPDLVDYDLVPTTGSLEFLEAWASYTKVEEQACNDYIFPEVYENDRKMPVVIKVDTGMSRNGCQPGSLDKLIYYCEEHNIPVHSIMTHFSSAWDNPLFTDQQMTTFLQAAAKYRSQGIKLHVANSAGVLRGYGTDLDYVRPGIAMYGLPPDTTDEAVNMCNELGLRPILSWLAKPNLVKTVKEGTVVGYDNTYRCDTGEIIGTLPFGYADGYKRCLSGSGIVTAENGQECPVVGRVSMDATTIKLPEDEPCDHLYVIKDDYLSKNSVVNIARQTEAITYEVTTGLGARLARLYCQGGRVYRSSGRTVCY